ncbi:MAG: extracellular solute-binding protein [Eubacteriales bacterium]|nr:extracellular solute-binding protein [Eubacteriales bacterium]
MKKTLVRLLSMMLCVMLVSASAAIAEDIDWSAIDWESIGWQADPENLEWKQKTDPTQLSYYVNFAWFGLNYDDPTAQKMTERTGVSLEFTKPVADDGQKLNMMIAGNTLPDIMTLDRNDPAIKTMIDAGMLYSIDELIEQYAPQMKEILPKELLENYKAEDGKTYVLTTWVQGEAWQKAALKYNQMIGTNQYVWAVRQDYFEEIGSPEIKTADDFTAALEKMAANHPDKLAFYCADNAMAANTFASQADLHNVGIQFGLSGSISVLDGQAKWAARDPKFLEGVKFLNTLAAKGLLTKDCFIDSKDVQNARLLNGEVIAFSSTISDLAKIPADNPETTYIAVGPLESYQQTRTGAGWLATVVPKTCKDPERAILYLEYCASVQGHADASWGVEGDTYSGDVVNGPHWTIVDGKPVMLADYMAVKNADWSGVAAQNGLGEYWFVCNEMLWNLAQWDASNEVMAAYNEVYGPLVQFKPELDIAAPSTTSDEGITLQKAKSLLQEYSVKLVFEENPEATYNEFIAKLDDLGMDKVETYWNSIYQARVAK